MTSTTLNWADVTDNTPIEQINQQQQHQQQQQPPSQNTDSGPPPVTTITDAATSIVSPVASPSPSLPHPPSSVDPSVDSLSSSLSSHALSSPGVVSPVDADDPLPIPTYVGLHPNDNIARVVMSGASSDIYKAASSFESLALSPQLLQGVYAAKFTTPSKIQAQALPIILDAKHPNLIGQAHHGSGKTAAFSLGCLSRIDVSKDYCQALVVCPTRELAIQVYTVMSGLAQFTPVKLYCCVPSAVDDERGMGNTKITAHCVIGTPGKLISKLTYKDIDSSHVTMFVADEADQMIDTEGMGEQTMKIRRRLPRNVQVLLFSATFDQKTKKFANALAPQAIAIEVKTEELSLDSIKQFFVACRDDAHKYSVLTAMYGLLQIGQSIIFVHSVATAKLLANKMRSDGYTVSLLHGKDMQPKERDTVMEDFRAQKTTVLITTNVLARGIDVLSVTLVINFDIPLNKYNKPDFETYIHRIGRSGRFGRKGVAINFVTDAKSKADLAAITKHFEHDIVELPVGDMEALGNIVQAALK